MCWSINFTNLHGMVSFVKLSPMNFDWVNEYCLSKPATEATFPFDETTCVWKVAGKMFCLADIQDFNTIAVKCDPDLAVELREQYEQIQGAYHMNKKLWNQIELNGLSEVFISEQIDNSYELVVQKLPKKLQQQIRTNNHDN